MAELLTGDLGEFGLPDVLRLLALSGKSGRLEIDTGGRRGRVELEEGRVLAAAADLSRAGLARRLVGAGTADVDTVAELLAGEGAMPTDPQLAERLVAGDHLGGGTVAAALREHTIDGVLELVRAPEGEFHFHGRTQESAAPASVTIAVEELLAEVAERSRALEAFPSAAVPPSAPVAIVAPESDGVAVSAEAWSLLGLVDGRRTVGELVELRGCGAFETHRILSELLEAGVLVLGTSDRAGPSQRLLDSHRRIAELEAVGRGGAPTAAPAVVPAAAAPAAAPAAAAPAAAAPLTATVRDVATAAPHLVATTPAAAVPVSELPGGEDTPRLRADRSFDAPTLRRMIDGVEALS